MANATVHCDTGYVYSEPDSATRTCQKDNTWSGQGGACNSKFGAEMKRHIDVQNAGAILKISISSIGILYSIKL